MLHGFNAGAYDSTSGAFDSGDGREAIAYVPSALYPKLNRLTDPGYSHEYFVDSSVTFMDAFFAGDWHSVLLGGLGGGGQSIYALDITDPTGFNETNAQSIVLWEFGDRDDPTTSRIEGDPDMGFTYNQPANVVRLHDGKWYAIFGNGYDNTENDGSVSTTGNAVIYILDLETGDLVRKLDTGNGMADDPDGASMPNGMSTVAPVDVDGDFVVDVLYAGDLFGNLWKVDLRDIDPLNWAIPYVDINGDPAPLFVATADNGNAQPITERPVIGRRVHADQLSGRMVYVGTGKYIEVGDNIPTGKDTQTFYGIWDKDLPSGDGNYSPPPYERDHLLAQSITSEPTSNNLTWRLLTNNEVMWHASGGLPSSPASDYLGWRLDLINTALNDNLGERSISDPVIRSGRVIFTTLVPSQNPCDFGGTGWLMEVDVGTGGRLPFSPFDVNGDFGFTADDFINGAPVSGVKSARGIPTTPGILVVRDYDVQGTFQGGGGGGGGGGMVIPPGSCPPGECKKISTSTGDIFSVGENPGEDVGRQTWRQVY
jgi:type IV pilus assembly protein PilY1